MGNYQKTHKKLSKNPQKAVKNSQKTPKNPHNPYTEL
jgi:hypothetical protein